MSTKRAKLDVALIHYPVLNKQAQVIGSAVTNLDVHDISRAGRTFGVAKFYVVTPFEDQQALVGEIADHWLHGLGGRRNPDRKEALSIMTVRPDLDSVLRDCSMRWGKEPRVVATCAKECGTISSFADLREAVWGGNPHLLLFGTAWGLAPEIVDLVDGFLPPIVGGGDYNHLSVRSAVSIVLDRLLGS